MNNQEVTYNWIEVTSIIAASTLLTSFIYAFTLFN